MRLIAAFFICVLLGSCFAATSAYDDRDKRFSFALIGDLPYDDLQFAKFDRVIADINDDERVTFTIHGGDIKSGPSLCDDAMFQGRFAQLQQLEEALLYTPGDNEWTDCHYAAAGRFRPLERLAAIRKLFYPEPGFSTGGRPIRVLTQGCFSGFETFVENSLWLRGGVLFATLHVVGSNNGLSPWSGIDAADSVDTPRADRIAEFKAREAANLFWLERIFETAKSAEAAGVFLAIQGNPNFELPEQDQRRAGFNSFLDKLTPLSVQFLKPVILAHGDAHYFRIDKPLVAPTANGGRKMLENFTRVEAFGSPNVHWVRVNVDSSDPDVFLIEQRIVPENKFPR
ncbi:MAG: hypothetical protein ACREV9_04300 [Burkholderiales bacterium]